MQLDLFFFGLNEKVFGGLEMSDLLGGKGANLCEMAKCGIAVPPGFVVPTSECVDFYKNGQKSINKQLLQNIKDGVIFLEKKIGKKFGGRDSMPLLLSVRSGAKQSMPGMMDTILNLGLTIETVEFLTKNSDETFILDSYSRLIQMYANVVHSIPVYKFEEILQDTQISASSSRITAEVLRVAIRAYLILFKEETGEDFPQDPWIQLEKSVTAVFLSWGNERAKIYRKINNISDDLGTAVVVQTMVFGNLSDKSATGVLFTRNPSTGEKILSGEYLQKAQGEDVVAGGKNPHPIIKKDNDNDSSAMITVMPQIVAELIEVSNKLELHYRDMQDIEFTVEDDKLWILQTRSGKRSIKAAIKIARDMVAEGILSKSEAILRIPAKAIDDILHPQIDPLFVPKVWGRGLPASPGVATGLACFSVQEVETLHEQGQKSILIRSETSPDDINGMYLAAGILTSRGGLTSHAAVVARGMGRCCIVGCESLVIDAVGAVLNGHKINKMDLITINGHTGEIIFGAVPTVDAELDENFTTLMSWCDEYLTTKVRANAETERDCLAAIKFGASGVGLCRTEHMFFEKERILPFAKLILLNLGDRAQKESIVQEIMDFQKKDFKSIMQIMDGKSVNIRLLDPPLHEFLPTKQEDLNKLATELKLDLNTVTSAIEKLHESNPMLGHRGSRLGITMPDLYSMQLRAIFEAYLELKSVNINPKIEIMMPFVVGAEELLFLKDMFEKIKTEYEKKNNLILDCLFGTMIETPRACLMAEAIANTVDYCSFGTNDLTQSVWSLSRDDGVKFIADYLDKKIISHDPFIKIDKFGVGQMMEIAIKNGKKTKQNISFSVCGEHGGNIDSLEFFSQLNLSYVSCSPYRIPAAKLKLAQINIAN